MSAQSARIQEDAFRIAHADLIAWVHEDFGFDPLDAYQLVTQAAETPIANATCPGSKKRYRCNPGNCCICWPESGTCFSTQQCLCS